MQLLLGILALLAGFWKSLGTLAWPFCRSWLSRGPSLGFLRLVSLQKTELREKALQAVTEALATSLPFSASSLYIDYVALSLGFLVGVRLRVTKVEVVLQREPDEARWAKAEEAVRSAYRLAAAGQASSKRGLVANAKRPSPPTGILARLVEMFIAGTHVSVDEVVVVFQSPTGDEELKLCCGLELRTSRSWKIELRGTHLSAHATLQAEAGGQGLLLPTALALDGHLPRVLRTLLMPKRMPNKTALLDASVDPVSLLLCPAGAKALNGISDTMARFGIWKKEIEDAEDRDRMSLTASDLRNFVEAIKSRKKDLSQWEQHMSAKEILEAYNQAESWPVPEGQTVEEWLQSLAEEQKTLRSVKSTQVSLKSLKLEILQASEKPGMGCSAQVEDVKISAATEETEPLALSPEQLWSIDALASQTPNVKAEVVLGSVCLECEPSKIRAASLLRPCRSDLNFASYATSLGDVVSVKILTKAVGSEPGLVGSVSSRAVWRLQCALRGLAKAAEATSSDQTSKAAGLAASRREVAMEKKRERADASMEKVRALFEKLDADRSGRISATELRELLENMYGKFMAPQEIDMAVTQLIRSRGGADRSLSFEELKSFFQRDSGPQAEQDHICLELQELTKPLPKKFQATAVFDDLVASMKDSKAFNRANIAAETLQLYWVRTLRNYTEAKRLWQELLAPSLEPHLKYWALRGTMPATDFWSDPAISLRALPHRGQEKQKDLTIHLSVTTDGFSIRLADTQHASSVPRAKLDISDLKLEGALFRAAGSTDFEAASSGFRGGLQLSAEYWNQTQRLSEPFVEPWGLRLEATRELFALRAEKHLVLNLTPPLLQALTVAINSLSLASDEKASTFEDPEEAKPIAVWVFNRTQCDVRICARSPEGERSSPVEISRWSFDAPVALELAAGAAEEAMGDANSRWILELEVRGGDADTSKTGEGWWVRQELPFSTTGRRLFPVGPRHLAVQFSVDVRTLAPVVSLSGICMLQNMTSQPLSVDLGVDATGTSITAAVKPYETWHAGIGGGYEVSMPLSDQGSFKMKLPLDTTPLDDEQILLARSAGYRYVLLPPDAKIRPGSVRDRVVVCVPMLSVLNALPCELSCTVQSMRKTKRRRRLNQFLNAGDPSMQGAPPPEPLEEEPPRPTGHTQELVPGQRLGFNEVDPELAVQVVVRMAGFTYTAVVPAKCLKSKNAVARATSDNAQLHFDFGEHGLKLICDNPTAPLLDVDLDWEMHGAVLTIFSRYWIADKTGWRLDVASGAKVAGEIEGTEQARAVAVPAKGVWSVLGSDEQNERLPQLALMNLHSEDMQLRLLNGCSKSVSGWAWSGRSGETLNAWWGTEKPPPVAARDGAEDAEPVGEETGWSPALNVGILGSTGVAQLPKGGGLLSSISLTGPPAAEVGVTVAGLPAPFERTKLVQVVPRYVVRNQLNCAVEIWPSRGSSKKAPDVFAHLLGTWKAAPVEGTATSLVFSLLSCLLGSDSDSLLYESFDADGLLVSGVLRVSKGFLTGEVTKSGEAAGQVRLCESWEKGALLWQHRDSAEGEWGEETVTTSEDARAFRNPAIQPGDSLSIGAIPVTSAWAMNYDGSALQPLMSLRVPGEEDVDDETRWSVQIPLSAVGDSVVALARLNGRPLLVRVSTQLDGATLFLILSRGQWPFEIENRSCQHSVVFYQQGADVTAPGCQEWILRPCEARRIVFPDPEKPKTLVGRILGAGQDKVAHYQLDNISAGGRRRDLWLPGTTGPSLRATLKLRGAARCLRLYDPEANEDGDNAEADHFIASELDEEHVWTKIGFDIFLSGLHVCLVDTLISTPQELLGFTVDYVQLEKPRKEKTAKLTVHHIQLDDFGDEEAFLLGPMDSGLNARTSAVRDVQGVTSRPMLAITVQGPTDRATKMFDGLHRAINLRSFCIAARPIEVRVDVPRLLYVAKRLRGWTASIEQPGQTDAVGMLERVLPPGFRAPAGGDLTCSLGILEAQAFGLNVEMRLTRRRGDQVKVESADAEMEADSTNMASQLRKSCSRFGALRPLFEFFARLGASFADASPRFKFSPLLISDASAVLPVLQGAVMRHYMQQLLQQLGAVVGSLQLLGDPANLLDEIGSGVMSFFSKTKEEVLGQRAGLGSGVSDLAEGIFGGTLGSFAKVSGSLKDTVGSSLGQPMGSDRKALNLTEGLDLGYASIATGISEGISAVVKEPFKQANEDGLIGLASGVALGAASAVVRPMEGLLGAVEKLSQGAEGEVRGRYRGYGGLRRPPRVAFYPEAHGLQVLAETFFWPIWLMHVDRISLPSLWLERSVLALVVYLRHSSSFTQNTEVKILRGSGQDRWCAEGNRAVAAGRVGKLRGPSAICIDAILETNLEFAEPTRAPVACAAVETSWLAEALASLETSSLTCQLQRVENAPLNLPEGALGEVEMRLSPALDPKILPVRFLPPNQAGEDTADEVSLSLLGPVRTVEPEMVAKDMEITEEILQSGDT